MHRASFPALVSKDNPRSHSRPLARAQHCPPIVGGILLQQEDFKLSLRVRVCAAEPSGDHTRIVEHQQIARTQVLDQIAKLPMLDLPRVTMQNQQTRLITLRRRRLRYQLRRQLEIKVRGSHGSKASFQSAKVTRAQIVSGGQS